MDFVIQLCVLRFVFCFVLKFRMKSQWMFNVQFNCSKQQIFVNFVWQFLFFCFFPKNKNWQFSLASYSFYPCIFVNFSFHYKTLFGWPKFVEELFCAFWLLILDFCNIFSSIASRHSNIVCSKFSLKMNDKMWLQLEEGEEKKSWSTELFTLYTITTYRFWVLDVHCTWFWIVDPKWLKVIQCVYLCYHQLVIASLGAKFIYFMYFDLNKASQTQFSFFSFLSAHTIVVLLLNVRRTRMFHVFFHLHHYHISISSWF